MRNDPARVPAMRIGDPVPRVRLLALIRRRKELGRTPRRDRHAARFCFAVSSVGLQKACRCRSDRAPFGTGAKFPPMTTVQLKFALNFGFSAWDLDVENVGLVQL